MTHYKINLNLKRQTLSQRVGGSCPNILKTGFWHYGGPGRVPPSGPIFGRVLRSRPIVRPKNVFGGIASKLKNPVCGRTFKSGYFSICEISFDLYEKNIYSSQCYTVITIRLYDKMLGTLWKNANWENGVIEFFEVFWA